MLSVLKALFKKNMNTWYRPSVVRYVLMLSRIVINDKDCAKAVFNAERRKDAEQ